MYDLLIIGSGPAGSTLALNAGLSNVIAVDKKAPYRPIICGEMVPTVSLLEGEVPEKLLEGVKDTLRLMGSEVLVNEINEARVVARINGEFVELARFKFPAHIIDKEAAILNIVNEAKARGAVFKFNTTVEGCVRINGSFKCAVRGVGGVEYVQARMVAGADSYPSTVHSLVTGYKYPPRELAVVTSQRARGYWSLSDDEILILIDPKLAPGGFAWVFPRGDGTSNVGLGARADVVWFRGFNIYEAHLEMLKILGLRPLTKTIFMKTIPTSKPLPRIANGGVFLVGDAAGTVIPTNGAGINTAMISSIILARHMSDEPAYVKEFESVLGRFLRRSWLNRLNLDQLTYSEYALRRITSILPRSMLSWGLRKAVLSSMDAKFALATLIVRGLVGVFKL